MAATAPYSIALTVTALHNCTMFWLYLYAWDKEKWKQYQVWKIRNHDQVLLVSFGLPGPLGSSGSLSYPIHQVGLPCLGHWRGYPSSQMSFVLFVNAWFNLHHQRCWNDKWKRLRPSLIWLSVPYHQNAVRVKTVPLIGRMSISQSSHLLPINNPSTG